MSNLCQIRVSPNGKYCCDVPHLRIAANCIGQISYANLPATALEYEITPDVWVPASPAVLEGTGEETIINQGEYRFVIDCEALNGTDAPEDPADQIALCFEDCKVEDWGPILSAQLDLMCEKLVAGNDGVAIAEVVAQLELICAKLLDLIANIGDLSEVCDKLEAVVATLETVCEKIETGFADMTAILETIKDCITQSQESLEAICTKLDTLIEINQETLDLLSSFKVIKEAGIPGADYNGAFRYINGRPPASSAWALIDNRDPLNQVTIASGDNLNAFTADLESKGYTEWSFGEEHWVCPCPEGLTAAEEGAYFVTVDGETSAKLVCTPLAEVPEVPETKILDNTAVCALRTVGCNDDRRDNLLEQMLEKLCQIIEGPCPECPTCPELIVGAAEFTTDNAQGNAGDAVTFPLTNTLNELNDIAVPIALPEADCFTDPDAPIVIRWNFDHEIEASTNHTGFNVGGSDGTATVGTVVGTSSTGTSNVGPGATPHTGPRDDYWVDLEFTVAELQAGLALQTSAFGAVNGEFETIHAQSVEIQTDLAELGCC